MVATNNIRTKTKLNIDTDSQVMDRVKIVLSAVIGKKKLSLGELLDIKDGQVINMGEITDYVDIYANDLKFARGKLIEEDSVVSIEIVEILDKE